jgi:hypothetical protein
MKSVLLFLLMCFLGGAGGALGSMAGAGLGRGGVFAGGFIGGVALVIAGGFLAQRWHWIKPPQRFWTLIGGVLGFGIASLVTLTTLSSPVGPVLSTLLIGTGAVLGAQMGWSAHEEP